MTPPVIEPATFRLVAQCLNQLCHQQCSPTRFQVHVKFYNISLSYTNTCDCDANITTIISLWKTKTYMYEGESYENIKYFVSRNLLNKKGTQ
jgi:hypothetical protein